MFYIALYILSNYYAHHLFIYHINSHALHIFNVNVSIQLFYQPVRCELLQWTLDNKNVGDTFYSEMPGTRNKHLQGT